MSSGGSVTHWIGLLKAGDHQAAQALWERYFWQLVTLARKKLRGSPRRAADEEDVALCAFDSFFKDARLGHFPRLADRDDLWRLLVTITAQKSLDLQRREKAQKRGAGRLVAAEAEVEEMLGREPTPAFAALMADECRRLLERLGDEQLRSIALWKMEGYSIEEIADKLRCVPRTVERRLQVIRKLWGGADG
jgi:RNA polymerase sigma factor (sigma-70 family)